MSVRTSLMWASAAIGVACVASSLPAAGQAAGQPRGNSGVVRRPAAPNFVVDLRVLADTVGKDRGTRIIVDPTLTVAARPTAPAAALDIDKAVAALAAQARGATWRRVYIAQGPGGAAASTDRIVTAVRALEAVEQAGIVVEDAGKANATYFKKGFPVTETFADDLAAQNFGKTPVYVIFGVGGPAGSPEQRFEDLQRAQMEMMLSMSPEQLTQAMQRSMQMFMNMDPAVRGQMMSTMMRSGMEMFQSMSPEQRNELIQQAMQNAQGMFGGGAPGGTGPGK